MPRLLLVVVCLWVAAVAAQSSTALSQQTPPQTASPQTPAPAAAQPAPQTPALPAGYAGSDTCVLCHTDQESSPQRNSPRQAKNPRSPAAALGCESCHGPGQAHVDDEAKGQHPEVRADEAGRRQPDVPDLSQPWQRTRAGKAARTKRGTSRARPATACTVRSLVRTSARQDDRNATVCHVPPRAGRPRPNAPSRTCRCARARWPARRATTRTARSATSRR